jgi:hypothetical protein
MKENTVSTAAKTIASFAEKAFDAAMDLSQVLCDLWHKGELTSKTLHAVGVKTGELINTGKLSFPIIAEACADAMFSMDDARALLKGVSEGSGYGSPAAISQALSKAGYESNRKGAGGRKSIAKPDKAVAYVKSLKMTAKELAAFKALVAAL